MAKPKASKKPQKRGVDFKKIKRKIGRKLPPPKNATNTEIKSKAIVLPEQSVASEKAGLAVSKKGLTLKELLQQTSHHNPKVRKDALLGIKDLVLKYPTELKLHKLALIEKLRERISDDDKVVRQTLYQLLKSVILPGCKEENQGPFISLMMAYVFNAMTHLTLDVRLMAFKFFDLLVQNHPTSFSLYAEKILQSYEDILQKNQLYLQDKGRLKNVLAGLSCCLSLLPCDEKRIDTASEKGFASRRTLHAFELDVAKEHAGLPADHGVAIRKECNGITLMIFSVFLSVSQPSVFYLFVFVGYVTVIKKLAGLIPVLVNCFQEFMPLIQAASELDAQFFDCMLLTLQSLDQAVSCFIYGSNKYHSELQVSLPSYEGPLMTIWRQRVSTVVLKKVLNVFPLNPVHHLSRKDDDRYFILNIIMARIFLHFGDWVYLPAALGENFLNFVESTFSGKVQIKQSGKGLHGKYLVSLLASIPRLLLQLDCHWKCRLLEAFTMAFKNCSPESSMKMACLATIEEMLVPKQGVQHLDASGPEVLGFQIAWITELPLLLILLGDSFPSCSKAVLHLQLRLGQCIPLNSPLSQAYDNMQHSMRQFYSTCLENGSICYGPFTKLTTDCQELSVCCLYYFSFLDPLLLKSIISCCLCADMEPFMLFRIIEVLHSSFQAGHVHISDHISFFITLLSCYKVLPEKIYPKLENDEKISNRGTLKSMTSIVGSCVSQIGDNGLVLEILDKVLLDQMSLKLPVDNTCAMLRVLIKLDSRPTRLSDQSIIKLSSVLAEYLIDVASCTSDYAEEAMEICRYYLVPGFVLFDRSDKLLKLVLNMMESMITEDISSPSSHTIAATVNVLHLMHKDVKASKILLSCMTEIDHLLQTLFELQSSKKPDTTIEERHKVQYAYDRLKVLRSTIFKECR